MAHQFYQPFLQSPRQLWTCCRLHRPWNYEHSEPILASNSFPLPSFSGMTALTKQRFQFLVSSRQRHRLGAKSRGCCRFLRYCGLRCWRRGLGSLLLSRRPFWRFWMFLRKCACFGIEICCRGEEQTLVVVENGVCSKGIETPRVSIK